MSLILRHTQQSALLFSVYYGRGELLEGKYWSRNVDRDSRVRPKIGNDLLPCFSIAVLLRRGGDEQDHE